MRRSLVTLGNLGEVREQQPYRMRVGSVGLRHSGRTQGTARSGRVEELEGHTEDRRTDGRGGVAGVYRPRNQAEHFKWAMEPWRRWRWPKAGREERDTLVSPFFLPSRLPAGSPIG